MAQESSDTAARVGILDLFARYAWAFDCGDADAYAETFTVDGVLADFPHLRVEGRTEIRAAIAKMMTRRGVNGWQHRNDNLRMKRDGESYVIHSYWNLILMMQRPEGDVAEVGAMPNFRFIIPSMGYYVSRCVRVGEEWLFSERTSYRGKSEGLPWKKPG
jgi:uncharacterized protein (TIGR02246 family)